MVGKLADIANALCSRLRWIPRRRFVRKIIVYLILSILYGYNLLLLFYDYDRIISSKKFTL